MLFNREGSVPMSLSVGTLKTYITMQVLEPWASKVKWKRKGRLIDMSCHLSYSL